MTTATKHILVVYYSQSGQLADVVDSVCEPLKKHGDIQVHELQLRPLRPFPFPWPKFQFFNQFPECVYLDPMAIEPPSIDHGIQYDLIILGYQPWFLSPSQPMTAFLQLPETRQLVKNKPVVTLIACRNMWYQAHCTVSNMLNKLGARLVDNVVLVDQGSAMASFITTPRWMFTANKNAFWGLPPAGIAEQHIRAACRFGEALAAALAQDLERQHQPLLTGLQAVTADIGLIQSEKVGYRSFRIWGKLLRKLGNQQARSRKFLLIFYIIFLVCLILTVVPVLSSIKWLTRPLLYRRYSRLKYQVEQPSGSGSERMEQYTCQKSKSI